MIREIRRSAALACVSIILGSTLAAGAIFDGRHSNDDSLFSESEYLGWLAYLAADDLEGRGTGQEGIDKAAEYIAGVFEQFGVRPAGDDDTYFQSFTLPLSSEIGSGTRLAVGRQGRRTRRPLRLNRDFVPFPFSAKGSFRGEVVFAGYGIVNDAEDYNDYEDVDVTDKVVLLLRRGPEFGDFDMRDKSFRAKASRANARDAAAILIVNRDGGEDEGLYDFNTRTGGRFGSRSYGVPMLHIGPKTANRMLDAAGLPSLRRLQQEIEETKQPKSAVLEGVTIRGKVNILPIDAPVRNVVGLIPGEGPQKDEIILLGAHYDHLGIRKKGEPDFDSEKDISNGADDNASGTAMLMTLAKAYTQGNRPNRTLVIVAFTAEELGLLGSRHFTKNPTVDLDNCIAMINFDMVGRLKKNRLEVGGMRTGDFEDMVQDFGSAHGINIKDGGGGRGPSDHTNFYNLDIPVLFFFTGLHRQYHRPEDDTHLINSEGAMRIARLATDVIDEIDSRSLPPEFHADARRTVLARQSDDEQEEIEKEPSPRTQAGAQSGHGVRLGVTADNEDNRRGILVENVAEDSPAARAGIRPGDRILKIGRQRIKAFEDAAGALSRFEPGDETTVRVKRGRRQVKLTVRFDRPEQPEIAGIDSELEALLDLFAKAARSASEIADGKFQIKIDTERIADSKNETVAEIKIRIVRAKKEKVSKAVAHGDIEAEAGQVSMPPVRLGIMPSYGETEGEGYEITGVIEGGAAHKAGMRDDDRIYSIGGKKITNVYEYMDALRSFKPGDAIPVIIIRDEEKLELEVVAEAPKSKEAA